MFMSFFDENPLSTNRIAPDGLNDIKYIDNDRTCISEFYQ